MRTPLLSSLLLALCLSACTDHNGSFVSSPGGPEAPVNDPDSQSFQPGPGSGTLPGQGGGEPGGGAGGGSAGGGGAGGGGSGSGNELPPGVAEGQPVPEPSTLLLVGTGLAGVALLRRRRRTEPDAV